MNVYIELPAPRVLLPGSNVGPWLQSWSLAPVLGRRSSLGPEFDLRPEALYSHGVSSCHVVRNNDEALKERDTEIELVIL